jgi:2-hydroxychromene-2-carboxylate isomerase
MAKVDFYFDYLSPYAYLAQSQLASLTDDVSYRPFDIRVLMPAVGNVPTSLICKPKNQYVQADLKRWVQHYGVAFQRNPHILEIDTRRLLRATLWAQTLGPVDSVVKALFAAMWGTPKPLQSAKDVSDILSGAGLEQSDIETEIDDLKWDAALNAATEAAQQAGVFGAPTIIVGEEMFFGNDRLNFVRAALARSL